MSGEQLEPGTLLNGRYRILQVIGKGGMGTVYQAEHVRLDTILAVKEVRAPQTSDVDSHALLQQCEQEARFLVKLHHPNLPQVTDAFLEDERFFVVMEYIEGVTLEARERDAGQGGLPVGTVIEWALQVADVLAYLHSQEPPIIFRDLKPANIMVQADGRIRLIDFGIARRFQPGAVKDTNLLGSVGYSPPEQFGRHQTDTRTDIYAFGATLHNLLTGRDPSHAPFKFAPVRTLNPAVPDALSRLIDTCLRLDADARPQTIHEVAMDLLTIRDTLPSEPDETILPDGEDNPAPAPPPNIIMTNSSLRGSGKTQRGSQKVGSGAVGSDKLGSQRISNPSGGIAAPLGAAPQRAPSAALEPSAGRRVGGAWLAGITVAVIMIGVSVWAITANARHPGIGSRGPTPGASVTALPPHGDLPAPPKTGTPEPPPAVTPSDTGSAPIASPTRSVVFDSVGVKGTGQDSQGRPTIRLEVSGSADGQTGDQVTIAAFFYDAQSNPVASQLPRTAFSSKDGNLSVATIFTLTAEHSPFTLSLELPISAFPQSLTDAVQFHCVAFYGSQRIGETRAYTSVPAGLISPVQPPQTNPGAPVPETSTGTSGLSSPPRPGTMRSAPPKID